MFTTPTVSEFKLYFTRDFPFGDDAESIMDSDISRALTDTEISINESLFGTQDVFTVAYLYLTAHHLVTNLRNSSQGIAGQFSWLTNSKSVGSVSESFAIPQKIMDSPQLSLLTKTTYGVRYLELVIPALTGAMFGSKGGTNA